MWHQNVGYFVVWFVNSATEKIQNILPHFFRVASGNLGRYMRFDCQSFVTLSRAANNKLLADLRVKQTVMPRQLVKTALWGHQCLILVTASWCALNSTIASICIFASLQIMFVISWNLRSNGLGANNSGVLQRLKFGVRTFAIQLNKLRLLLPFLKRN